LGIAAAIAAAMLTASIQAKPLRDARLLIRPEEQILVAAKNLEAMTILDAECLEQRTLPGDQAPEHCLADPAQAVGKLLTVPVVEGQALTENLFAPEGSGLHLAGLLEPGMRAVTVSLSDYSGLEGLLYPGCRVDVMGTFAITGANKAGSAVSTALLENVQVLAVGRQAVGGTDGDGKADADNKSKGYSKKILVTLMVDANQAEALQLGMEHGLISLAMRNPRDKLQGNQDATLLSEGRLAQLAKPLDPTVEAAGAQGKEKEMPESQPAAAAAAPAAAPEREPARPASRQRQATPEVKINVIRGIATETVSFPYPQS
jgi:pilus assembly protein CpaB